MDGQRNQREWNGAPFPPVAAPAPISAMEQTQPRMSSPQPLRAATQPDASASSSRSTNKRKRITDSAWMPALRLNRRDRARRAEEKPRMVYDTENTPGYLRLARLLAGLALLAAAWGVALLVVYLAQALWSVLLHQPILTERFVLYLLYAVGIIWLAVVGLALIVSGAFSLFLALTRRRW